MNQNKKSNPVRLYALLVVLLLLVLIYATTLNKKEVEINPDYLALESTEATTEVSTIPDTELEGELSFVPFVVNGKEDGEIERLSLGGSVYVDVVDLLNKLKLEHKYENETLVVQVDKHTLNISKDLVLMEIYPDESVEVATAANPEVAPELPVAPETEAIDTTEVPVVVETTTEVITTEETTEQVTETAGPDIFKLTVPSGLIEYEGKLYAKQEVLFVNGFVTVSSRYVGFRSEFDKTARDVIEEAMYVDGLMPGEIGKKHEAFLTLINKEGTLNVQSDMPISEVKYEDFVNILRNTNVEDVVESFGEENKIILVFDVKVSEKIIELVMGKDSGVTPTNLRAYYNLDTNEIYFDTYVIDMNSNIYINFDIKY